MGFSRATLPEARPLRGEAGARGHGVEVPAGGMTGVSGHSLGLRRGAGATSHRPSHPQRPHPAHTWVSRVLRPLSLWVSPSSAPSGRDRSDSIRAPRGVAGANPAAAHSCPSVYPSPGVCAPPSTRSRVGVPHGPARGSAQLCQGMPRDAVPRRRPGCPSPATSPGPQPPKGRVSRAGAGGFIGGSLWG